MKHFVLILALTVVFSGCSKEKSKKSAAPTGHPVRLEEKRMSGALTLYGRVLEIDKSTRADLARRQVSLWKNLAKLDDQEQERYFDFNDQVNPLSVRLQWGANGELSLYFQMGHKEMGSSDLTYTELRSFIVPLVMFDRLNWVGSVDSNDISVGVSCIEGSDKAVPCDPLASSLIEIKNAKSAKAQPMIAVYYYASIPALMQKEESRKEVLALGEGATFTSIFNLNNGRAYARLTVENNKDLDLKFVANAKDALNSSFKLESTSAEIKSIQVTRVSVSDEGKQIQLHLYDSHSPQSPDVENYESDLSFTLGRSWRGLP